MQASGWTNRMPAYTCGVQESDSNIIFFDGECAMCSRFVRFCLKRDSRKLFRYAPIDGATWKERLGDEAAKDKETIHLLMNESHLIRSSAIVEIFRGLGGIWSVVGHVIWLIPRPIRNLGYRIVAGNRQRVSKVTGSCSIPDSSERSCLLP